MTSKEFEQKIKELGYEYFCDTGEIEEGVITEYIKDVNGHILLNTSNSSTYDIDTVWYAFDILPKSEKDKLFYVFYQYIKTDIKDRGLDIKKVERTVIDYRLVRK
ncbi:hypothetical protein PALS1_090 [Staphylococcus phage PALS_1]|nr:hypothetical protein PALS1_090 [Staphylococcus phage PALS_1]